MPDLAEQLQSTLGDGYVIERELGGGGMSRTFVALDSALQRKIVIKVLPEELGGQVSLARFKREVSIAARLQHAHIIQVLSAGDTNGTPYFTMPYVQGESLRARLARVGELPLPESIRMLREVASALAYAHAEGVVHRDIKPDNVLLSSGAAMITDFGVAKAVSESAAQDSSTLTDVGIALGTPAYMAPEQVSADPHVDFRADIYAWGVLGYELLTGQPPFAGRSAHAVLAAQVTETPEDIERRRPSVPRPLARLIMRSLEKRPSDRPQSAEELVRELDAMSTPDGRAGLSSSAPASSTRRRASYLVLAVALLSIAGAAYWKLRPTHADADSQSIAVVPPDVSAGDSSDYFADGVIETLVAALAKVPGLEVRPSASTLSLRGKHLTDEQIGSMLHVGNILHVSVRRYPPNLRVSVEMSRVQPAQVLWTDRMERPASDVFLVQDSIAARTAAALTMQLGARDRARVGSFGTQDLAAYDYYLKARFAMRGFDEPSLRRALALLDSAVAKDPRYAQAYASMAEIWVNLADDWVSPREGYGKAREAATRALEIDSTSESARGFHAVASVTLDRDFQRSLAEAKRAFLGDSLQAMSVYPYAALLAFTSQHDSSDAIAARARALDPLNPTYSLVSAWNDFYVERLGESVALYRKTIALEPESPPAWNGLAEALLDQGKPREAMDALKHGEAQFGMHTAVLARTNAALGNRKEAERLTALLVAEAGRRYVSGDYIAAAYIALGKRDEAMHWLERANDERSQWMLSIQTDPRWVPLRGDPRFKALVARIASGT